LVTDRQTKEPASAQAAAIRRFMREHGVLVGVGGPLANVVRIQPPLVIADDDLDRAIDLLEHALTEVA
jgi:4-aminobutyrate aminotransferase-like enzyme